MWWEKTVEYVFVQRFMPCRKMKGKEGRQYLAPLDGDHEKVGDAIFSKESRLVLIEFKKSHADLSSERGKFLNFGFAKTELQKDDDHHLLVYGEAGVSSSLELLAETYFGRAKVEIKDFAGRGKELGAFKCYLVKFIKHRNNGRGGRTVNLSTNPPDDLPDDWGGLNYSVVVGITSGVPSFAMSLKDFISLYRGPSGGLHSLSPLLPVSSGGKKVAQEQAVMVTAVSSD